MVVQIDFFYHSRTGTIIGICALLLCILVGGGGVVVVVVMAIGVIRQQRTVAAALLKMDANKDVELAEKDNIEKAEKYYGKGRV